jgi:heme-degrading monooxygenase HmoA
MREPGFYSLVLALDYRVNGVERRWASINERTARLAGIGVHHVVLYVSINEPDRVLVTMGIRHRRSVTDVLRSPAMFEWFDMDGVDDIPAVFAGEVVKKIDLAGTEESEAAVIIGAVSTVGDVYELMAKVHSGLDRFREAGVRKVWLYRAFDDEHEVMTLMELDSLPSAQRWIDHPDAAAEWMSGTGIGAHPSLFVGQLAHVMTLQATQ